MNFFFYWIRESNTCKLTLLPKILILMGEMLVFSTLRVVILKLGKARNPKSIPNSRGMQTYGWFWLNGLREYVVLLLISMSVTNYLKINFRVLDIFFQNLLKSNHVFSFTWIDYFVIIISKIGYIFFFLLSILLDSFLTI